jgi:hypothetical protein
MLNKAGHSLGFLLDPEDVADMFLRNLKISPKYAVLQPTRLHSELLSFWTLSIAGILNTREHNASETGSLSFLGGEEDTYFVGSL